MRILTVCVTWPLVGENTGCSVLFPDDSENMTAILSKHKLYENVELAAVPYLEDKSALCRDKGQAERTTQEIKTKPASAHLYKSQS